MNIYECLKADHHRQRDLAARLLEAPDGSCETQGLFDELCDAVEANAAAEEQTLYAVLLTHPDGGALVQRGVGEHDEIVTLIDALADKEFCTSAWLTDFARLVSVLEHHFSTEETETLTHARCMIDPAQATGLGERYAAVKYQWLGTYGRQLPETPVVTRPARQPASQSAAASAASGGVTAGRRRSAGCVLPGRPSVWLKRIGRPLRAARRPRWVVAADVSEAFSSVPGGATDWRLKRPRNN